MSKRPTQQTLDKTGFTFIKVRRRKSRNVGESSGERSATMTATQQREEQSELSDEQKRIEHNRKKWQPGWKVIYDWLEFDYETSKVFCKTCTTVNAKTVWDKGGTLSLKCSAFLEHCSTDVHKESLVVVSLGPKPMERLLKV
ncbi:hypothetical protein R1flu_005272 [Riccia fluitans]|uniref:C17orf113 probable zinc finger domain-containing protein n=1 Tax=Riccia fluitans TaxID=41844 RepID=A0ABD1YSY9_9MARC